MYLGVTYTPKMLGLLLAGLVLALVLGLVATKGLAQQQAPVAIDLPAQSLGQSLVDLAEQTGVSIIAPNTLVAGKSAPAVSGTMAPEEAVRRLLDGSGLSVRTGSGGAVIVSAGPTDQEDDGSTLLGPIIVEAEALGESAYGPVDGYLAGRSATATKTDTAIRDTPNSIQVIPRDVIDDQQNINIQEVLSNAAGVNYLGTVNSRNLNFSIRGFDNAPILRNGLNAFGFGTAPAEVEVANIERAEVVRGPAVLYGQVEPGGAINIVTKKPLEVPTYNFELQGGNRKFISPIADLSGPVTEDDSLLYRLVALYRQEDSFQNYDESFKRGFVAPSATWRTTEDTDLTLRTEYTKDRDPLTLGLPAIGDSVADIPLDRVMNNPDDLIEQETLIAGYDLEHRFDDAWKLRNQFSYIYGSYDYDVIALPFFLDDTTGEMSRLFANQFQDRNTFTTDTNVQGMFSTGSVDHTGLVGFDFTNTHNDITTKAGFAPGLVSTIDIFDPDYNADQKPNKDDIPVFFSNDTNQWQVGVYAQDQIDVLENLSLVGGMRFDYYYVRDENTVTGTLTQDYSETYWSPRIGAVYRPIDPVSFYANYSQSFFPNEGFDRNGGVLPPEEGEGVEVGVKVDFIPNRLSSTLAFYDITKKNVATADPLDPFASVPTGEVRSRGMDVDLTGEILPGWNVIAGYAYIDSQVTEDNTPGLVGNRFPGVPRHSANFWTTYEIQSGNLKGLGIGVGVDYVGEREGDTANSFTVDDYVVANAGLFYNWRNWQARLNVNNIFDTDYIEAVGNSRLDGNLPGAPFTVRASVSVTF